ncbi:MAG: M4 family metallopeptidase, partial [Bacillota bacterium]
MFRLRRWISLGVVLTLLALYSSPVQAALPAPQIRPNITTSLQPLAAITRFKALDSSLQYVIGDLASQTPTLVTGVKLSTPLAGATVETRAVNFLLANQDLFGVTNASNLKSLRTATLPNGQNVVKLQQTYNGLPVRNGMLTVQLDAQNQAQAAGGIYFNQIHSLPAATPKAALTPAQAQSKAQQLFDPATSAMTKTLTPLPITLPTTLLQVAPDEARQPLTATPPTPELMYMVLGDKPLLVYRTEVDASQQDNPAYWEVWVDASTGAVVDKVNRIQEGRRDVVTGTTLKGEAAMMDGYYWSSGTHDLYDNTRRFYNGPLVYTQDAAGSSTSSNWVFDTDGRYGSDRAAAVSAQYYAGLTVDYFAEQHGLKEPWPGNKDIKAVVNYGSNYNNAFYNGQKIALGNGDGSRWRNFANSLDIVAHEISHGVVEKLAGLVYSGQSGALNESYADVFGFTAEYFKQPDAWDWKMGEDAFTPNTANDALRYLNDPSVGNQPEHMSNYLNTSSDYGGV